MTPPLKKETIPTSTAIPRLEAHAGTSGPTSEWPVDDRLVSAVARTGCRPSGFSPDMVTASVNAYTDSGGLVLEPFAGFGTTVAIAQRLGRAAVGLVIDPARFAYAKAA